MFEYISSFAIIVFETLCCRMFYESFCFELKENKKWCRKIYVILMPCTLYVCSLLLANWLVIKQLTVVMVISLMMCLYYKISIKKAIILALLYQGLALIVDYIAYASSMAFFSIAGDVKQEYAVEGNLVVILSKIVLFLCVLLVKKQFGKKLTEKLEDTAWTRFFFFPIFTIFTIVAMIVTFPYTDNRMQAHVLYIISFGIVIMNIFVYYLINDIVDRETKLHEKEILEMQVKNQMKIYHSISENYELQKSKAHEFKNQILCIEALLKEKEYIEASKYVNSISNSLMNEKNAINTNHVIINAILNTKYEEALKKQIVFSVKVNDLKNINIEDEDLVVLLANLLNNAIEACDKCEKKRVIKLKFIDEDDHVILSVKNTYNHPIKYDNNEIKTSKSIMPEEHGIGIKNVIRIIEKYDGSYVIRNDEDEFYFSIMF